MRFSLLCFLLILLSVCSTFALPPRASRTSAKLDPPRSRSRSRSGSRTPTGPTLLPAPGSVLGPRKSTAESPKYLVLNNLSTTPSGHISVAPMVVDQDRDDYYPLKSITDEKQYTSQCIDIRHRHDIRATAYEVIHTGLVEEKVLNELDVMYKTMLKSGTVREEAKVNRAPMPTPDDPYPNYPKPPTSFFDDDD